MSLNRFQRTREDHSRELNEDYVELIDDLILEFGQARITDLAKHLGVSKVTVSKRIPKLVEEGLVTAEKYRQILLTEEGKKLAEFSRTRHQQVFDFLVSLGVSPRIADIDAEGIEHHCSQQTLDAMIAWAAKAKTP